MMNVKKLAIYGIVGAISLSELTGCLRKNSETKNSDNTYIEVPKTEEAIFNSNQALNQIQSEVKEGETRIFEPYQHLFFIRVGLLTADSMYYAENINGGSINIPDGYQVLTIENFAEMERNTSQTGGYDIWFTNEVAVEVTAIYNESIKKYDYSHFGLPIAEKEKENEETIKKTR